MPIVYGSLSHRSGPIIGMLLISLSFNAKRNIYTTDSFMYQSVWPVSLRLQSETKGLDMNASENGNL